MESALLRPIDPERSRRPLAGMTLVNTAGSGLYFAAGTLYLTRSAGMAPTQVRVGLTLSGLLGRRRAQSPAGQ